MTRDEVIKELRMMHSYYYQFDDDRSTRHCEALQLAILAIESYKDTIGEWRHYEGMLSCSNCGSEFYDDIMEYCGDKVPRFCPDCGKYMGFVTDRKQE